MTVLKFAFRNLVRLPLRTLLYFSIVFFIALSISASLFVYGACANAKEALDESYIFVASLVPRKKDSLSLRDIGYCADGTEILSYNVSMSENNGVILGGAYMQKLPKKTESKNAPAAWMDEIGAKLVAVENLYLVPSFFSGECTMRDGTGITQKGYVGESAEVVIPWWFAEKYGISVGDILIRRYYRNDYGEYIYLESGVVGIYETNALSPNEMDYPVYIPLAVAELDYATLVAELYTPTSELLIERADFVLKDRQSFEPFVLRTKENGLDFREADLIFNNSSYDTLNGELQNITAIAMLVFFTVLAVGLGVLVFFTIYLCHARKREQELLLALGMSRYKISLMFAIELIAIVFVSALIGCGVGYMAADGVCGYVNESVLSSAELSEKIENIGSDAISSLTKPLEQKIRLEISIEESEISLPNVMINYARIPNVDEIGVSKHLYYNIGSNLQNILEGKRREPISVVGITDMSAVKTNLFNDVLVNGICVFVSKDFDMSQTNNGIIYLTPYDLNGYVSLSKDAHMLGNASLPEKAYVHIVGTYEENPYCSGSDMLVSMEDYHKLYSEFSITDENFYFERIGSVYPKEEK
ncbi:MAG: ABC transporter permease [Clostridia bacterium]|nr:ABC transporter permease [Clostridia bacterium]